LEALLVLAAVRWAFRRPPAGSSRLFAAERAVTRFAGRRRLVVLAVGLAALAGRAALSPILPSREPLISDEHSYLLAADTFASGRLTNPAHPMWKHFEAMHVNQQPTYMSMYPPAQGLAPAAGDRLAGRAWVGVWLSSALMCAAICWMLQGWLPPVWALLGGLLAVVRLGLFSYWVNSYWGGAVAAAGGALVLGALPRLWRRPSARGAVPLALGVAVLANSRPYEGLLVCLPAGAALLVRIWRTRGARFGGAVAMSAGLLSLAAAGMLYYNWRVTSDPLRLPYQVNREAYVSGRYFVWDAPNQKPDYRHSSLRDFYVKWQARTAEAAMTVPGFITNGLKNAGGFWLFYLGPLLSLPLVMSPWAFRDRRVRLLVLIGAVFLVGLALDLWFYPHYAAPATALVYAFVLQSLRHLRWARGRRSAALARLTVAVPVICLAMAGVRLLAQPLHSVLAPDHPATWFHTTAGNTERATIAAHLASLGPRQLVLVRYSSLHNWFEEWVYNAADIDGAKVVWAHDMGEERNRELLEYFRGREVWLVEPDTKPPRLSPYAPAR
ncbi:MAG TPA: hypothetical protein VLH09_05605, partial [Bryobacteraceae bacterium]|nr:hypothetical protein [Bryobacteraceae bacterium]